LSRRIVAEAGCITPQIAAIIGHSLKAVTTSLDKYLARTRVLASDAVSLFENARSTGSNQLQTDVAVGSRKTAKPIKEMARPKGFEPLTPRLVVW